MKRRQSQRLERTIAEHQARGDQLYSDVLTAKVNPNSLWESRTTGQRVGASIGIILSGIGQGLAGGPNMALSILERAIDRDIDAQKTNLAKGENALAMHMQRGRDLQSAMSLVKADARDAVAAQLEMVAAKFADPKAAALAQTQIVALRSKSAEDRQTAAIKADDQAIKRGHLAVEWAKLNAAKNAPSPEDKENRKALTEVEVRYQGITQGLDRLKTLIKGGTMGNPFTGAHSKKLSQEVENIAIDAAKISDPTSVNRESEVAMYRKMLFEPGFWQQQSTALESLANFRNIVEQRRNNNYRARGMGDAVAPASLTPGRK